MRSQRRGFQGEKERADGPASFEKGAALELNALERVRRRVKKGELYGGLSDWEALGEDVERVARIWTTSSLNCTQGILNDT